MGKHREKPEVVDDEVLFDPHGPMGQMLAETTECVGSDPLDVLLKYESWLKKHFDMTLIEAAIFGVRSKL
jgi:hypothetical protein